MHFNLKLASVLAASVLPAVGASAQAPPRDTSPAAIAAWIKANIQVGPYTLLETNAKAVSYFVLDDLPPTDARVRVWFRDEMFEEDQALYGPFRSRSMLSEFDCDARRWRFVATDWYPQLNLKGSRASLDDPDARWTYERSTEAVSEQVVGEACKAKLDSLAPAKPSPFR